MNGVINVYKEAGYTSHDVVARMRGILKQRKIGHTGTLDPDATGVLPVCAGNATKLCGMLTDMDKEYEAVLLLGVETDTQDLSGRTLRTDRVSASEKEVREAVCSFVGGYEQVPPMYSALKVNGKKLYELAREGKTVERRSRNVRIEEIRILSVELPEVRMLVTCSKGTYIRTLCHDIGQKLGCGGIMKTLCRTRVGRFTLESALTLEQIETFAAEGRLEDRMLSVDRMFDQYPAVTVKRQFCRLLQNGNALSEEQVMNAKKAKRAEAARMYDEEGRFYGIYEYRESEKQFRPVKMFTGQG